MPNFQLAEIVSKNIFFGTKSGYLKTNQYEKRLFVAVGDFRFSIVYSIVHTIRQMVDAIERTVCTIGQTVYTIGRIVHAIG